MSESTAFDSEKIKECADWLRDCTAIFNGRFKGQKLYQHEIAVYLKAVCCPDPDKVIEAVKRWLPNERHFPWPVDIRHVIEQKAGDKEYIALESTPFDSGKKRECVQLLRLISDFYNTPHLPDPDIAAYFNAVNCADADKVHQALEDWLCRRRGFPSPEDIRSRIRKLDEDKKYPEDAGARAKGDRISPLDAPCSPSASWKCGISNFQEPSPQDQSDRGAGAHQAASGGSEETPLTEPSNQDVSQ